MEEDVKRMLASGGDPLPCYFDSAVSIAFAKAVLAAGPNVRTFERDGLDEKGERTRWRGVKNMDNPEDEIEWFNFSHFCPPEPPANCGN